jgi:ElaB/YqjD/DUF883 family membrane-anchored ribosome-binding protein
MASPNTGQKNQSGFGQAANEMKAKAQDTAAMMADKSKDLASAAARSASEAASNIGHKVGETATNVGHKADDAVGSVGSGMKNLAGTVREKAPQEGMMGTASSTVAGALEKGGRYIEEQKLSGMANDFVGVLKENPLLTICIGVGIGFLIAQMIPSNRRT